MRFRDNALGANHDHKQKKKCSSHQSKMSLWPDIESVRIIVGWIKPSPKSSI